MNETKIESVAVQEDGTLTLSAELLPRDWTSPVWVLWEPEEAYLTLFPSTPDASTLEDVAEYGPAEVADGSVTLPPSFLGLISGPGETVTVRAEEQFVEIFGARVWEALKGAFTDTQDLFWL